MEDISYLVYTPDTVDYKEFLCFLQETDDLIIPRLSSRVNLEEYAKKVTKNATMFIVKKGIEWIAVQAVYFNPYPEFSFSTHLCVKKEYQNTSVGLDLYVLQRKYLKEHRTKGVRFAIRKSNDALLKFHLKTGATIIGEHNYPNTDIVELEMEKVFIK